MRILGSWPRATLCAAVVALAVTACARHADDGDSPGARVLQGLGEFERQVLSDKEVSVAEIERASTIYAECLTAEGFSVDVEDPTNLGPSRWSVGFDTPADDSAEASAAAMDALMTQCYEDVDAVEAVWLLHNQPTEEERGRAQEVFVQCVAAAGVPGVSGLSFEDTAVAARDFTHAKDPSDQTAQAVMNCYTPELMDASIMPLPGLSEALESLVVD